MSEDWSDFGSDVKQEAKAVQRGPRCAMGVLLDASEPKAREVLERVLNDRGNTSAAITRALRSRLGDDAPSQFTVNNHRRGNCRCGRVTR